MSNDLFGKSPKMWVNEITVKQLVQAKWDTKDAFPGQVPPMFICRCMIAYSDRILEAEGSGKTKKDAEQEAARCMLFTKLEMTPAKLHALNSAAKKKEKFSMGSHSSSKSSELKDSADGGGDVAEADDVSDSDDKELEAASNPIGDLMAICSVNDMEDPEYYEVNVEGPSHKRVFTMSCKVSEINLTLTGRRHKKQTAKKLAAYRVLREMKRLGYEYSSFEDRNEAQSDTEVPSASTTDTITLREVNSKLRNPTTISSTSTSRFGKSIIGMSGLLGGNEYCSDTSGKCLEYCVDYSHAFHHLQKSETLDGLMKNPYHNTGDSLSLLKKVANELGIRLIMYDGGKFPRNKIVFIGLKLPFNFEMEVPNKSIVNGEGVTDAEAKNNAAVEALNFLKLMIET